MLNFKILSAWWCHSYNAEKSTRRHIWHKWFLIKVTGKSNNLPLLPLSNNTTDTIKCFNFDVHMVLTVRKTKKSWSKLKQCQSMFMSAVVMRISQVLISLLSKWRTKNYPDYNVEGTAPLKNNNRKPWTFFLRNPCRNILQSLF